MAITTHFYSSLYVCHPTEFITIFFFFNDTATTEIYTLSLHDALPISQPGQVWKNRFFDVLDRLLSKYWPAFIELMAFLMADRKSTRLNSSHGYISYAVFCLKK